VLDALTMQTPTPSPEVPLPTDLGEVVDRVDNCVRDTGASLCRFVYEISGRNEDLAAFADVFLAKPIKIIFIIVLALLARAFLHRAITRLTVKTSAGTIPERLKRRRATATLLEASPVLLPERRRQRAETIGSVFKSIASFVIFTIAMLMILDEFGVNIGPILASAGIVGVAVGFGAQNLVKDFLSGIFMILEDQYGVGDVIDSGEATGTVEAVSLRTTRLRDVDGVVWYVRNGEVIRIGNKSQGWARAVVDIPVSYDEDIPRVRQILEDTATAMWHEEPWSEHIIEAPEVWGVEALRSDAVVVRVVAKTAPLQQWAVARELRQRAMAAFDAAGIDVPTPNPMSWARQAAEESGAAGPT